MLYEDKSSHVWNSLYLLMENCVNTKVILKYYVTYKNYEFFETMQNKVQIWKNKKVKSWKQNQFSWAFDCDQTRKCVKQKT
jgi:hypothetical protein